MVSSEKTKQALAGSLKALMEKESFSKISVSRICAHCGLSRKSLYYHFKDKYDLINWIFDTEFILPARRREYPDVYSFLTDICQYFYENRAFYQNALEIQGQNSFRQHFQEVMPALAAHHFSHLSPPDSGPAFRPDLMAHIITAAIQHWLSEKHCLPPTSFLAVFHSCAQSLSSALCHDPPS